MDVIEIPATADAAEIRALFTHSNVEWALKDPHTAWRTHMPCRRGVCLAKTVAWGELVRDGRVVPDSSRSRQVWP